MCGIEVIIEPICDKVLQGSLAECSIADSNSSKNSCLIGRRGPHCLQQYSIESSLLKISVRAAVLHIRGNEMAKQPVQLSSNNLFCWNGEVYQILNQNDNGMEPMELNVVDSDTTVISNLLEQGLCDLESHDWIWQQQQEGSSVAENETAVDFGEHEQQQQDNKDLTGSTTSLKNSATLHAVTAIMSRIWNGEYAFCLATPDALYFGRDVWGRRSLLTTNNTKKWMLASVANSRDDWIEVPPGRVYQLDFATGQVHSMVLAQQLQPPSCSIPVQQPLPSPPPLQVSELMWQASFQLQNVLTKAVERRVHNTCRGVGILFSGGLDSVVLAALASEVLVEDPSQPLELLNVNFGAKESADRKAALASHHELEKLYPARPWRLVCVDVEWEEVLQHESHIRQLIHPKHTTMDLNIATALWFASRGKGTLFDDAGSQKDYSSTCRVLLVGMGADEQMAGYGRHRTSYQRSGYDGLQLELNRDLDRLWERNLGRDDRVISDHGREARFPYLDTGVTDLLSCLDLSTKCNLELEAGVGDKQILRLVAHRLGLETAGGLVKRAIQFGSRMAHMSDTKRFSSRRKASGEARIRDVSTENIGNPNSDNQNCSYFFRFE